MHDLIGLQDALQRDADRMVEQVGLLPLLSAIGSPVRVGSSALGVMVRRDIDITVICPSLDSTLLSAFAAIGARLMSLDGLVSAVRFRNDCGAWNIAPDEYPDGLYLGITARDPVGNEWTFDIWAVDQPARQPDLRHLETLLPRLTAQNRATILGIKHALVERPSSGRAIPSAFVYEAVLDHGVDSLAAFEVWLAAAKQNA